MSGEETVWAQTTAGGMLHQLFGYYPSLHEAQVVSMSFDARANSLEVDVHYNDSGAEKEKPLSVRIRLLFSGVKEVDLSTYDTDIAEMTLHRIGDLIETRFQRGLGIDGHIISEGFEAILDKVDPAEPEEAARLRIRYRP